MSYRATSAPDATILSPEEIVRIVTSALNDGRIDTAVALFDEGFNLRDHALDLRFGDRASLAEFFEKRRDLFPELHCYVENILNAGKTAILQWKLEGFVPVGILGQREFKSRVEVTGISIVECESGRIKNWSDYYDGSGTMRTRLVTYFKPFD